ARLRRDGRLELVEVVPPAGRFVQPASDDDAFRGQYGAHRRRPRRIGHQYFVAGLEQRLKQRVEPVDGAVGDEDVFGIDLRNPVSVAELGGHQLPQARNAVGLQVVRLVPGDRAYDRRLHRLRRIEADVA